MEKAKAFLKKWGPLVLAGALVLFLTWTGPRACRLPRLERNLAELKGEVTVLRAAAEKAAEDYVSEKADLEKTIKEKDERIAEHQGNIDSLETILAGHESSIDGLAGDLAKAKTDAERVPILAGLVEQYKGEVFTLKQTINEKDKMYFSLREKYDLEHKLRLDAEAGWEAEKTLTKKLTLELGAANKIAASQRSRKTLWKMASYAVGAYILGKTVLDKG